MLFTDIFFGKMELSHSLILNEEALGKLPDAQKPVFVVEWLKYLSKVLVAVQKVCPYF